MAQAASPSEPNDQRDSLFDPGFIVLLLAGGRAVRDALKKLDATVDEITFTVAGVPVTASGLEGDGTMTIRAGSDLNGRPMFEWQAPTSWLNVTVGK